VVDVGTGKVSDHHEDMVPVPHHCPVKLGNVGHRLFKTDTKYKQNKK
jgi:hypothetical protein